VRSYDGETASGHKGGLKKFESAHDISEDLVFYTFLVSVLLCELHHDEMVQVHEMGLGREICT